MVVVSTKRLFGDRPLEHWTVGTLRAHLDSGRVVGNDSYYLGKGSLVASCVGGLRDQRHEVGCGNGIVEKPRVEGKREERVPTTEAGRTCEVARATDRVHANRRDAYVVDDSNPTRMVSALGNLVGRRRNGNDWGLGIPTNLDRDSSGLRDVHPSIANLHEELVGQTFLDDGVAHPKPTGEIGEVPGRNDLGAECVGVRDSDLFGPRVSLQRIPDQRDFRPVGSLQDGRDVGDVEVVFGGCDDGKQLAKAKRLRLIGGL